MAYLLDTNIVIAAIKGNANVAAKLENLTPEALILSPIVLGELEFGIAKSQRPAANRAQLASVVAQLPVIPLDLETSNHYGHIRQHLERAGTPIGANDLWIAAQALALNATLVTNNEGEFRRVPGLRVENWLG